MLKLLLQIKKILNKDLKKKILILQSLNIFQACIEVLMLGSLAFFISIINNSEVLEKNIYIKNYYERLFDNNVDDALIFFAICLIFLILLSFALALFINSKMMQVGHQIGAFINNKLYSYYLAKSWPFHVSNHFSDIVRVISHDSSIISVKLITPLLNLSHKLIIVLSISIIIAIYNPYVAIIGIIVFSIIYFLIIFGVKKIIKKHTKEESELFKKKNQMIINTFHGIKEIIVYNLKNYFQKNFILVNNLHIKPAVRLGLVVQLPRLVVEAFSYILIILSILVALILGFGTKGILPTLAVYAFAGLKLLPSFQQIYMSIVNIKNGKIIFDKHKKKIFNNLLTPSNSKKKTTKLNFKKTIELKNLKFSHTKKTKKNTLDINKFQIKKNDIIGIAGETGSGKSTLVDLIMSIIDPDKGNVLIDGKMLKKHQKNSWLSNFAFVSQNPYFYNSSILNNVAFGIEKKKVNIKKVNESIKAANLGKKILSLNKGIDTEIGDNGLKFSGGERQRMAIARALYFEKDVIVFDEATSSVDSLTEKEIVKSINSFEKKKTIIIIAHRLNTLKICNKIYLLKNGKIVGKGSFNELLKNNIYFKKLNE